MGHGLLGAFEAVVGAEGDQQVGGGGLSDAGAGGALAVAPVWIISWMPSARRPRRGLLLAGETGGVDDADRPALAGEEFGQGML